MPEPSFILDGMLGSLTRWLRMMGYDALYLRDLPDMDMLRSLEGNERFLLTRDRQLAVRAGERGLFVPSIDVDEQLAFVGNSFGLKYLGPWRCTECNGELSSVEKGSVKGEVQECTWRWNDEFWRCARCRKLYWKGAHWNSIKKRMDLISTDRGNSPR